MTFETYFELGQHKSQAHYNPKKKQILLPSCSTAIAIPQIKLETPSTTVPNLKTEPLIEQGFGQDSMECVSNAIGKLLDSVRECVRASAAGAQTRRSMGHHLLHPLF